MDRRHAITELISKTCLALDAKDFAGYLELCDSAYRYRITAYSPEIRKDMIWLEHDKRGMQTLFANLPRHNSDQSLLTRHVTPYTVAVSDDGRQAEVVSAIQTFRTTLDGGATELFAVGKLYDRVSLDGQALMLVDRNVRLETRMLGYGFHIPV